MNNSWQDHNHAERLCRIAITLMVGAFLASTIGLLVVTRYFSVMAGDTLKSTDVRRVREFARACSDGGDSYTIRTVWTETEPRKPILFVITCQR